MATRTRQEQLADALGHLERAGHELRALLAPGLRDPALEQALHHVTRARQLLERPAGTPSTDRLRVSREVRLPPDGAVTATAREFCLDSAAAWQLPSSTTSSLVDVTSELVANASRVSASPLLLALELDTSTVTARVWDDGPGSPRLLPYRPGVSERGLGLHLVKRLSLRWGTSSDAGGKWVWAVLARRD